MSLSIYLLTWAKRGKKNKDKKTDMDLLLKKITSRHDYVVRRADDKLEAT